MLPAALLVYRTRGDQVVPAFLGGADHPWLRALLDERARFVGRRRGELTARLREPLPVASPPRRRALAAHVLDRLATRIRGDRQGASSLRAAVFSAAVSGAPRDAVLALVAAQLGTTTSRIEKGLFADLPDEQPVAPLATPLTPVDLASHVNLALAQGLIARSDQVKVSLLGNALPVVRRAKLAGLIVNVTRVANRTVLDVSGPLALFHHTRVYGRALGSLLPLLAWTTRFDLEATCVLAEGRLQLRLSSDDAILPATEPRRFDSRVEERFALELARAAPEWNVIRDPEPLVTGTGLVFPDFALVHREAPSRRWLIEIVGFWTPDYLTRKLAAYRGAAVSNLVLCIDEQRRCEAGEPPPGARVIWYRRRIDPAAVLAAIAEQPTNELLEAIREIAATGPYGNVFVPVVERRLCRVVALDELMSLCRAGSIAINRPTRDLAVRPLDPPRPPLPVEPGVVERHLLDLVRRARGGPRRAVYHLVREHFDWLGPDGEDRLRPLVDELAARGVIRLDLGPGAVRIGVILD